MVALLPDFLPLTLPFFLMSRPTLVLRIFPIHTPPINSSSELSSVSWFSVCATSEFQPHDSPRFINSLHHTFEGRLFVDWDVNPYEERNKSHRYGGDCEYPGWGVGIYCPRQEEQVSDDDAKCD